MTGNPPCCPLRPQATQADLPRALWRRRRLLGGVTLAGTLLGVLLTLLLQPTAYQSRAAILPQEPAPRPEQGVPQEPMGLSELLLSGLQNREDRAILAFLRSRTLQERMLARPGLVAELYARPWDFLLQAVGLLPADPPPALAIQQGRVEAVLDVRRKDKGPVIELSWLGADPATAATRLAQVLEELERWLDTGHETEAGRERRFLETQLAAAQTQLTAWENRLPDAATPLPAIQREVAAATRLTAELRGRLFQARMAEARQKVAFRVLDAPFVPARKHAPRWSLLLPLYAAAALLAGMLLAAALPEDTVGRK